MNSVIKKHLLENEEILWEGQPSKHKILDQIDYYAIKFFFLWTGITSLMIAVLYFGQGGFTNLHLIFIPFLIIGVLIAIQTISRIKFKNASVFYYLTNERIILLSDTEKNSKVNKTYLRNDCLIESILLENITSLDIKYLKNDIGNLHVIGNGSNDKLDLYNIDNVYYIYKLILKQDIVDFDKKHKVNANTQDHFSNVNVKNKSQNIANTEKVNFHKPLLKEKVLWEGQQKYSYFSPINLPFILFGLFWNGFMIYITFLTLKYNPQAFNDNFVLVFFAVFYIAGFYIIYIIPTSRKIRGKNRTYIVTNNQVIIYIKNSLYRNTYNLDELKTISVQINKNNTGNPYLTSLSTRTHYTSGAPDYNTESDTCFLGIENPIYVYKLIRQQQQKHDFPQEQTFQVNPDTYKTNYNTIRNLLLNREFILWTGRPKSYSILSSVNMFMFFILGIIFTGMATLSFFMKLLENEFSLSLLFYILSVVIGLSVTFGIPISRNKLCKKTLYIVTDKGISIYIDRKNAYFKSIWYSDLEKIESKENKDGSGEIYFNPNLNSFFTRGNRSYFYYLRSGFYEIENVNQIYNLILKQKELYDIKQQSSLMPK